MFNVSEIPRYHKEIRSYIRTERAKSKRDDTGTEDIFFYLVLIYYVTISIFLSQIFHS